jgi:pyridoxine 5'-phosphate synthase PdxJ
MVIQLHYWLLTGLVFSPNLERMARITVNLEPLAGLYHDGSDLAKSMVKNALACEVAGADSILIGMGKEYDQKRKKVISLLVESLDINLSIKCGHDGKAIEALQDLKPGMVIMPYQPDKKDFLASTITNLQVENILTGLEVPLELEHVKEAAKLKCDYVILNCGIYCQAKTINARLDELGKISKLVALSSRLSMGAVVSGDFTPNHISQLAGAAQIEEYMTGLPFISSSLIYGYKKAIENLKFALG